MKPSKYFVQEISPDGNDDQYVATIGDKNGFQFAELKAIGSGWTARAKKYRLIVIAEDDNGIVGIGVTDRTGKAQILNLDVSRLHYLHALLTAMNFHEKRFNDLLIGKVKRVRT